MSAFQIKMLAILAMTLDHVGVFLFPDIFLFRIIGRPSFLLFAWLIAIGARHTSNIYLYFKRLLIFAIVSQVPFMVLRRQIYPESLELNIFFTLALGLLAIIILEQKLNNYLKAFFIAVIIILAQIFCGGFSYGAYGVIAIIIFYLYNENIKMAAALQALAILIFFTIPMVLREPSLLHLSENIHISFLQPISLIALVFIAFYNKEQGSNKFKRFFYYFYPLHLVAIYLISVIFKNT